MPKLVSKKYLVCCYIAIGLLFQFVQSMKLVSSDKKTIKIFNIMTGCALKTLKLGDNIKNVIFSAKGDFVAELDGEGRVEIRKLETGKTFWTLNIAQYDLIALNPPYLFSIKYKSRFVYNFLCSEIEMRIWDVKTGKILRTLDRWLDINRYVGFFPIAFSQHDPNIIAIIKSNQVSVFDIKTNKNLQILKGKNFLNATFNPHDSDIIVTKEDCGSSRSGKIKVWDIKSDKPLRVLNFEGYKGKVGRLAFSCHKGNIIASSGFMRDFGSTKGYVEIWDIEKGSRLKELFYGKGKGLFVFNPKKENMIVTVGSSKEEGNCIKIWDINSGKPLRILKHSEEEDICAISFFYDETFNRKILKKQINENFIDVLFIKTQEADRGRFEKIDQMPRTGKRLDLNKIKEKNQKFL